MINIKFGQVKIKRFQLSKPFVQNVIEWTPQLICHLCMQSKISHDFKKRREKSQAAKVTRFKKCDNKGVLEKNKSPPLPIEREMDAFRK